MSEPSERGGGGARPVLEERVEPLPAAPAPQALAEGDRVLGPEGESLRIIRCMRDEPPVYAYEAALSGSMGSMGGMGSVGRVGSPDFPRSPYPDSEGEGTPVWLREALDEGAAARLRREAEVLRAVACPGVPRVLACFEREGRAYLASRPLVGATLADVLAGGAPRLEEVISCLAEVAGVLAEVHARGWAHLGLRPASVGMEDGVTLLDFSYATPIGEKPEAAFYHGGYSPPELFQGEAADARADVYALGALLFHAAAGRPLPEAGAQAAAWEGVVQAPGVPQILQRCLGGRESRYAAMAELRDDLLRLACRSAPAACYSLAAATTIGLELTRTTNQDAYACIQGSLQAEGESEAWVVACVADGMGGMAAGEAASRAAARAVLSEAMGAFSVGGAPSAEEQAALVRGWVHAANDAVCAVLAEQQARGGCTLVCACLVGRRLAIGHVGDCRLYLLRADEARQLTRDHSLAMAMVLQGEATPVELRGHPDRSKVTRSLGDRRPMPDYYVDTLEQVERGATLELEPGDALLLCSDGLWEPVLEEEMVAIVRAHAPDLNAAADALLHAALERGAPDNATVVLVGVEG